MDLHGRERKLQMIFGFSSYDSKGVQLVEALYWPLNECIGEMIRNGAKLQLPSFLWNSAEQYLLAHQYAVLYGSALDQHFFFVDFWLQMIAGLNTTSQVPDVPDN
jgi:hypothetical protein